MIESLAQGGAERALLNLVPALLERGVQPVVLPLKPGGDLQAEFEAAGAEVVQLNFGHKWNLPKNTLALARFIKTRRPDIVHAHLFFAELYVGLNKLFFWNLPTVISFHNLAYAPGCNPRNFSYYLRKLLAWFMVNYCMDRLVAVSSVVASHYAQNLRVAPERFSVIGNGVPDPGVEPLPATAPAKDAQIIVALGRLVPEKGYSYLLQAFARLSAASEKPLELQIIGDGPRRTELVHLAEELGVQDSVHFLGNLAHQDAMQTLALADLFVAASVFEGFGLAVAEAILLEVPVVATDVGGMRDIVLPGYGEIVPPGNVDALVEGISRGLGLDATERARRQAEAKRHVLENYSVDAVSAKLVDLYREELANG